MTSPMYPVKYTGPRVQCANFVVRPRRPLTSDYRQPENAKLYRLSTVWQVGNNPSTGAEGELWMLSKIVANIATWVMISGGGAGTLVSVTGDDGVVTVPDGAGNLDLVGNVVGNATHAKPLFVQTGGANTEQWDIQLATAVAPTPLNSNSAGLSSYNNAQFTVDPTSGMVSLTGLVAGDLHVARFIVSADLNYGANFTDIATAIAAAVVLGGVQTVFIQPGVYTEDITLAADVNLCAFACDGETPTVTIIGKMTATFAGSATISGIRLQTNGNNILEVSGVAATRIKLVLCFINITNANAFVASSSGGAIIEIYRCRTNFTAAGINFFALTNGSAMRLFYCHCRNDGASVTANTVGNACILEMAYTIFPMPISSSGSGSIGAGNSSIGSTALSLTLNGTGTNTVSHCSIGGPGVVEAITIGAGAGLTLTFSNIAGQTPNVITGAGTLTYGYLVFNGTGSTITTAVQTALVTI